jgi:hypothetical protein
MAIIDEKGAGAQWGPEGLKVRAARGVVHAQCLSQSLAHAPLRSCAHVMMCTTAPSLQVTLDSRAARSRLGTYYERRRDGSRTLFTSDEGSTAAVTDVRVYVGIGVAPGTEGYKPSMLQCVPALLVSASCAFSRRGSERGRDAGATAAAKPFCCAVLVACCAVLTHYWRAQVAAWRAGEAARDGRAAVACGRQRVSCVLIYWPVAHRRPCPTALCRLRVLPAACARKTRACSVTWRRLSAHEAVSHRDFALHHKLSQRRTHVSRHRLAARQPRRPRPPRRHHAHARPRARRRPAHAERARTHAERSAKRASRHTEERHPHPHPHRIATRKRLRQAFSFCSRRRRAQISTLWAASCWWPAPRRPT